MTENEHQFCADIAREHGVPLLASATRGDLWFLLEYSGSYEAKAFEASSIPEAVKNHLQGVQIPGIKTRILLIRQDDSHQRQGVHFFIGHTHPQNPKLYQYQLETYNDILDIDLAALAEGGDSNSATLRNEPLFLVCTNGRRDLCCARFGPAIYQALSEEVGEAVWQSSHIGGHNKAPNTLFFPYGVEYGRTTPEEIRYLVQEYRQNRVGLENYRGRVCFDPPVQAAEHFWRQETGILDLPGMQIVSADAVGDQEWQAVIRDTDGSNQRQISIQRWESDTRIPVTCAQEKLSPISTYHRIG